MVTVKEIEFHHKVNYSEMETDRLKTTNIDCIQILNRVKFEHRIFSLTRVTGFTRLSLIRVSDKTKLGLLSELQSDWFNQPVQSGFQNIDQEPSYSKQESPVWNSFTWTGSYIMSHFLAEPTSIHSLPNTIFDTTLSGFHSGQLPACSTVVTALTTYSTLMIPCGNALTDHWFRLGTSSSVMAFPSTNSTSKSPVCVSVQLWTVKASMAFLSAVLAVKFNPWTNQWEQKNNSLPIHGYKISCRRKFELNS